MGTPHLMNKKMAAKQSRKIKLHTIQDARLQADTLRVVAVCLVRYWDCLVFRVEATGQPM
jgi:hypothetical protein